MSLPSDLRRRIAGGGLVVAGLLSTAVGYAFTIKLPALEVSAVAQLVGAVGLCGFMLLTGRSPFKRYDRVMWAWIARLFAGNAIVAVTYTVAVRHLTLGTAAAVAVLGYLSVGITEIWRLRYTAWGLKHLCGRALVVGGIVMLNRPWQANPDALGIICAAASAVCVWNTVSVLGRMKRYGQEDQGATIANLLAAPALIGLVFALRGGGRLTWHLLSVAGLAGLLTLFLPVLLLNAALRRSPASDVGVVQSLASPVHALVAEVGVLTGLLGTSQRITFDGWAAIILIAGAALGISLIRDPIGSTPRDRTSSSATLRR